MKLHTILLGTTCIAAAVVASLRAAALPDVPPVFSHPLTITNPYSPFVPGRVMHFEIQQGHPDGEVFDNFLLGTRTFTLNGANVECRILEEFEKEADQIVEISHNFFAQADDGTVYYFGELVDIYENGSVVDHSGSWLVGGPTDPSDPAETANAPFPGVFMPASPQAGDVFKQEDLFPIVDETDTVVRSGASVSVPGGRFTNCIEVRETSLLTDAVETKWYAPGLGFIKSKEKSEVLALDLVTDP